MGGIEHEKSRHRREALEGEGGKEGAGDGSKDQLSFLANTLSSKLSHSAPDTTQLTATQAGLLSVRSSPVKAVNFLSDTTIEGLIIIMRIFPLHPCMTSHCCHYYDVISHKLLYIFLQGEQLHDYT